MDQRASGRRRSRGTGEVPLSSPIQPITTPAREQHAIRSPSGADWWGACPGAPELIETLGLPPREAGPAAEWGTMVHGLAEAALKYALGRGRPPMGAIDSQAKEVVDEYTTAIFSPEEPLCECSPAEWVIGVEERGGSEYLPHSSGTRDFVAHCPTHGWLRVVDLKTGHGEVEAEGNQQGAIYALHDLMSKKYRVNKVVIEIIQPRSPSGRKVKRWTLTPLELLEMLPVFIRKVQASMTKGAPLVAGEKQCKYCAAAAVCPERRKAVTRSAQLQFGVGSGYTPEQIAEAKRLVPQLLDWCKSVDSLAYQEANRGTKIPGFKLAQKRDGNRKWIDETAAANALLNTNDNVDIHDTKLKSPAQLERVFDKELINSLCTREPGGTVLVEESDNRPAVIVDKLATFQHLLTKQ